MKRFVKRYKQLCVLLLVLGQVNLCAQASLSVQISSIKQPKGKILYSLYNSEWGFPDQPAMAYRYGSIPVSDTKTILNLGSLPPGEYALAIIHDANGNGKLDMNALGIPTESVGFSNNVMGAFGPPKFQRARFSVRIGKNDMNIKLRMGQ